MWFDISDHHKSPLKTTNVLPLEVISKTKASDNKEVTGWGLYFWYKRNIQKVIIIH